MQIAVAEHGEVHLAGNVHFGEQAAATGGVTSGLIGLEQQVTWRAKHFGIWQTLTSKITKMDRPIYFQDVMLRGAFGSMEHDHYFRSLASGGTEMKDVFIFAAPLPVLGGLASGDYTAQSTQVYLNGEVFEDGGVAVSVGGDVKLSGVISQGCTPIGDTWTLTRVEQDRTLTADRLGDQRPPATGLAVVEHRRVELDELDVADRDAGP